MHHCEEVVRIFKTIIEQNSYDVFCNRKRIGALCEDYLARYSEERMIFSMLFRSGLAECIQDGPYETAYDMKVANAKIKKYLESVGIGGEIQDEVIYILSKVIFVSDDIEEDTIESAFKRQQEKFEDFERSKKSRISIEKRDDFDNCILSEVEDLYISSHYEGELPPLKQLKKVRVFFSFYPMKAAKINEISMYNLEEMTLVVEDSEQMELLDLNTPKLKRLRIYIRDNGYQRLSPIEKMLSTQKKIFDFGRFSGIQELEILDFDGFDISSIGLLKNLTKLTIRRCEIENFLWLADCKQLRYLLFEHVMINNIADIPDLYNLRELRIYSGDITSIDNIKLYPNLEVLDISYNNITKVGVFDNLQHLRHLNMMRNPLLNIEEIRKIGIPELIILDADRKKYSFDRDIEELLFRAYKYVKSQRDRIDEQAPFVQKSLRNKTIIESFKEWINIEYKFMFYRINPTYASREYNIETKAELIEYTENHYPFIEIKEEYKKQIQKESFGIQFYHKRRKGGIVYVNESVYLVQVGITNKPGKLEQIETDRTVNLDKRHYKDYLKRIEKECPELDLTKNGVAFWIDDFYVTGNNNGLDFAIVAAIKTLYLDEPLSETTYIAGEYKDLSVNFKRKKISSRIAKLSLDSGAENIIHFSSLKTYIQDIPGLRIHVYDSLGDFNLKVCCGKTENK